MSYSQLALLAVPLAIFFDIILTKTRMIFRKVFWTSYAIIFSFQLLTNWWLTSRNIVIYGDEFIFGVRILSAPIEDVLFGFALILSVISLWIFWGAHGVQNERGKKRE